MKIFGWLNVLYFYVTVTFRPVVMRGTPVQGSVLHIFFVPTQMVLCPEQFLLTMHIIKTKILPSKKCISPKPSNLPGTNGLIT